MNPQTHVPAWALALCLVSSATLADESVIGYIKSVQGDATVLATGHNTKAEPGTPVKASDVLKTGKDGSLGITLRDNTVLSIGPDTEFVVEEYVFNPAKDELKLGASLGKGTLNYVSGLIAKLKPSAVSVRTPTGTIGVRGTHFVALVVPE
jgi:hypothetical protein